MHLKTFRSERTEIVNVLIFIQMLQSLILAAGLAAVGTYAQTAPAYDYTVNGVNYTNPTNIYIPSADAAVPGALFNHLFVIIFENTVSLPFVWFWSPKALCSNIHLFLLF